MSTSSSVDLESEAEAKRGLGGASASLKLFSYSRQAEFERSIHPRLSEILGNTDISIRIAELLYPFGDWSINSRYTLRDLNNFSLACTATYPSGVAVLYRTIAHITILWGILIDTKDVFVWRRIAGLNADPRALFNEVDDLYGHLTRDLDGEDLASYKLRRFLFICSHVQSLCTTRRSFTVTLSTFFMQHIPSESQYLFPALKKISWIETDRNQAKISLRTSPIGIPAFQAFRPTALRFLSFELHDRTTPLSSALGDKKFLSRIVEFIALLGDSFPNFYEANLCVCHANYCAHPYVRRALNKISDAVLKSEAVVVSKDIPLPVFSGNPPRTSEISAIRENIITDVITGKGRTFIVDPQAPYYYYPVEDNHLISTVALISPTDLSLCYRTNMSVASVPVAGLIVDILRPFIEQHGIQHLTVELESVAIALLPRDILRIGTFWPHLHCLDLRFKVVRENVEDMPTIKTVRMLTNYCPALHYLCLPDLNVQGFRGVAPGIHAFSLTSLTSAVLLSSDEEAKEVASALLSAFPNLTDVVASGISALGWNSIGQAIMSYWNDAPRRDPTAFDPPDDTGIRLLALLVDPISDEDFERDMEQDMQLL